MIKGISKGFTSAYDLFIKTPLSYEKHEEQTAKDFVFINRIAITTAIIVTIGIIIIAAINNPLLIAASSGFFFFGGPMVDLLTLD
jgi:hypothetical protein